MFHVIHSTITMYNFTPAEKEYYETLVKALEAVKANPKHWNQAKWHCGTSHCLGGFGDLIWERGEDLQLDKPRTGITSPFSSLYPVFGRFALIFDGDNTLEMLEYLLGAIGRHGFLCDFKSLPGYYGEDGYDRNGYSKERNPKP